MKKIIDLLQYKGTFSILKTINYIPKKYSAIKQQVVEEFSSRTLDHRLNDLVESGLIERRKNYNSNNEESFEYLLTEKGQLIESIFNSLDKLDKSLNFTSFIANMSNSYNLYQRYDWNRVKETLLNQLQKDPKIYTLKTKKVNIVENIEENGLKVSTEKGTRIIEFESIKKAYKHLLQDGKLSLDDHLKSTYRSSFICALLAKLDWVEVEIYPKVLLKLKKPDVCL